MWRASLVFVLALACGAAPAWAQSGPVVSEIRIHGNYRTPDAEVAALAGLTLGEPLGPGGTDAVAARLRKSGRFPEVEVRLRYRTLDESGGAVVIIMVQEVPGSVIKVPTGPPNPLKRLGGTMMFAPVLEWVDGYGLTYGLRTSFVHVLGKEGRLSVPLTWGDRKQAALEAEKAFATGPLARLSGIASISSRENPGFDLDDRRNELGAEAVVPLKRRYLNLSFAGRWSDVDFGDIHERATTVGAGLTLDTRQNPAFPRNAVVAAAGWKRLDAGGREAVNRYHLEAQGYLGLFGSTVLAVRALSDRADAPLPAYEKALAGGSANLRGFRAGSFVGDSLAAGSVELRLPWNSPMRLGQSGFTIFGDAATAYDHGTPLEKATWHYGAGAGWYLRAPLISLGIDVGYGFDEGARAHVMAGLRF